MAKKKRKKPRITETWQKSALCFSCGQIQGYCQTPINLPYQPKPMNPTPEVSFLILLVPIRLLINDKRNLDNFSKWVFHRFCLWLLKFELCIFWTMRSSRKWRVAKQQEKGLGNRNYFFMTAKRMDIECHSKNVFAAVDRQGKAGR